MRHPAPLRLVVFLSVFAALAVSPALACLWDRDTLAMEAKGMPQIVEIITGRFFRAPPKFYEMRLERVAAELEKTPDALDLYDDVAVACDRLGRSDEAIAWMERKRQQMDALLAASGALGDHEYRYHANLGTFHAHRWIRLGGPRGELQDLEAAREHIGKAIDINPDAHFGRERYQLLAIEWLLDPPAPQDTLPSIFDAAEVDGIRGPALGSMRWGNLADKYGLENPSQGLGGLVVLGSAWESFDVFYALAVALNDEENASLAVLARLRCEELLVEGRTTILRLDEARVLHEDFAGDRAEFLRESLAFFGSTLDDSAQAEVSAFFARARREAKDWHEAKTAFMLAKLERGEHPDTHPDFWEGFVETSPPRLPGAATLFLDTQYGTFGRKAIVAGAVALLALCLIAGLIWALRRARSAPAETRPPA